jgi:CheY-like chemotaxis protein
MQNHHGMVAVRSTPGRGTVFELYFPEADSPSDAAEEETALAPGGGGERILLVDDEPSIVRIATRALERLGYEIHAFTDPEAALAAVRVAPGAYALVITDLTMPRWTGLALAREIRRLRPDMPVVLMSGYMTPEDEGIARATGISATVAKPFTSDALAGAVHQVMRRGGGAIGGRRR